MNFDQQPDATKDDVTKKVLEAKQADEEKKFDPEAERKQIYARANERMDKLFQFRKKIFEKAGEAYKDKEGIQNGVLRGPGEYQAFSAAHIKALDKKNSGTELAEDEKAALLYQTKYNEIQNERDLAIASLEEKIKAFKPEEPKTEEPKVENPQPNLDLEKMMSEI